MAAPTPRVALVGDIGGTNARFALADLDTLGLSDVAILSGADFPTLADAANAYLARHATRPRQAALAIAAPILGDTIQFTNSPWVCSVSALTADMQVEKLSLLNDFEALAQALPHLDRGGLVRIGGGEARPRATKIVLGPGTGLGIGGLVWSATGWTPVPGEGGHVALAAETREEFEIIETVRRQFGRVSAERLLSGPGLSDLHDAIRTVAGAPPTRLAPGEIIAAARDGDDPPAVEAVDRFIIWLGRFAGDMALSFGARGGVYIGGGIAPRILPELQDGRFRSAFDAKGRMTPFVAPIPIHVITTGDAALTGVAAFLGATAFTR